MKKKIGIVGWLLLVYLFVSAGCQKETTEVPAPKIAEPDHLVSATQVAIIPQNVLQTLATRQGFAKFIPQIKHDVAVYNLVYTTTYKGKEQQASGLLAVPQNMTTPAPLLSTQHGTMFLDADAPTNFPNTFSGFELFAATGYITLIPDYLGYGISKDVFHPYYDQKHSGLVVVDMIKAVKSYANNQKIKLNNNLFLVGYSEGGYVTMAAQKEIETHPEHGLKVTAAAEGAGGYDLTGMLAAVTSGQNYGNPSYLAFVLQSYNTTYNWNRPLTDFFQEPYATRIPELFNGASGASKINNSLSKNPAELFNPTFYAELQKPDGEKALKQALVANSFLNWVPQSPTRLYHGTADQSVFFQTSQTVYDRFKAAGAPSVEFISIPGGTHSSSLEPMILLVIPWIQSLNGGVSQ
ncbi:alpha/beta hydrolase family protein [Adhaeribacter radiodurans]|uniref:Alpha/beta fold hydrolase n=1 Tax=Adhaeribacter radiodurans TaxID=2745197 RepID=A0A7L7L9F5_9BACT|nr:alpha/beta fold hydrolase [Adhaeribacter radiodurans]QMU29482.1 alpha/beta fold hydrolase [Adhaeribacter radiodurans]